MVAWTIYRRQSAAVSKYSVDMLPYLLRWIRGCWFSHIAPFTIESLFGDAYTVVQMQPQDNILLIKHIPTEFYNKWFEPSDLWICIDSTEVINHEAMIVKCFFLLIISSVASSHTRRRRGQNRIYNIEFHIFMMRPVEPAFVCMHVCARACVVKSNTAAPFS